MKRADVATVLARHGIDPAADEMTLTATLEAWVGRPCRGGGHEPGGGAAAVPSQSNATAAAPGGRSSKHPADLFPDPCRPGGRTAAEALALVLATVLERRP